MTGWNSERNGRWRRRSDGRMLSWQPLWQRKRGAAGRWARLFFYLFCLPVLLGCAATNPPPASRPFRFQEDTFAFANELVWEYYFHPETDKAIHLPRRPPPAYSHHCFILARSARQFFQFARFDPDQPVAPDDAYRPLVRRIARMDPARSARLDKQVVIPGYTNLYQFSQAQETVLKEECGSMWRGYFQRGNWRMILPFPRSLQEKTAQRLVQALQANHPPVVHLVAFPSLSINHVVVLFDYQETKTGIAFETYDPNTPERPTHLFYDRADRSFSFPRNRYYRGGRLNLYPIYRSWLY